MKSGDGQFMVSSGPVIYDSVYNGEIFDSRLADESWDSVDFDITESKVLWRKANKLNVIQLI